MGFYEKKNEGVVESVSVILYKFRFFQLHICNAIFSVSHLAGVPLSFFLSVVLLFHAVELLLKLFLLLNFSIVYYKPFPDPLAYVINYEHGFYGFCLWSFLTSCRRYVLVLRTCFGFVTHFFHVEIRKKKKKNARETSVELDAFSWQLYTCLKKLHVR